jgi:NAD(P)-dependent dehydrogenase (short-subunit alcohol dehydrogenase family)
MKAVIVTGAGSGIGKATALRFSEKGYFVYLLGRNKEKLEEVALLCQNGARRYGVDLTSEVQVLKTVQDILGQKDTEIKILINNAAIFERHDFESEGLIPWRRQFETNLFGSIAITQSLLGYFKEQKYGSIVNIASTLGLRPIAQTSAYSASKAAMVNWTQSLALEVASYGIRVNCVCPGIVDTSIHGNRDMKSIGHLQPLGRVGLPEEIAKAIEFLGGEQSSWTTGSILTVDGGIQLL